MIVRDPAAQAIEPDWLRLTVWLRKARSRSSCFMSRVYRISTPWWSLATTRPSFTM